MIVMLSVYLGLFNLLPLPALDGGRAVFLGSSRSRASASIRASRPRCTRRASCLLLGVLLVVSFKDIFGKG